MVKWKGSKSGETSECETSRKWGHLVLATFAFRSGAHRDLEIGQFSVFKNLRIVSFLTAQGEIRANRTRTRRKHVQARAELRTNDIILLQSSA